MVLTNEYVGKPIYCYLAGRDTRKSVLKYGYLSTLSIKKIDIIIYLLCSDKVIRSIDGLICLVGQKIPPPPENNISKIIYYIFQVSNSDHTNQSRNCLLHFFSDISEGNKDYSELRPCSSWTGNSDKKLNVNKTMYDFRKNSLSKVLQNFLSVFKMSQVLVQF